METKKKNNMTMERGRKADHAVFIPFPGQGHVIPMMRLAKLLHWRGFHVTFVYTAFTYKTLVRSQGPDSVKGLPDFQITSIPDGIPPADPKETQDLPAFFRKYCRGPFVDLIRRLESDPEVPPVTCVVSDGLMSFGIEAAREVGLPGVQLWIPSPSGFLSYLHFDELVQRGIFPFKDESFINDGTLDTPIDWIPGMRNIRLRDLPSYVRTTDPNETMFHFHGKEAQSCLKADAILFNTFDEFEPEVLEAIASKSSRIYTIGPLPLLGKHVTDAQVNSLNSSLLKEDSKSLQWLDQREPSSVLYVNYGSVTQMTAEHMREFAWGLANSKHPFLWIVRHDLVKGDSTVLSEEFSEEIKDRGLIVSWCSQDQVLEHPSVGAFLTHCGWNSMMETICVGLPVICWPYFADHQTNCRYACTDWGIGVEIDHDVNRKEVEALVKDMMEGDQGKQMRNKAKEWKDKAEKATNVGGSSYNNFERLIKEALRHVN